MLRNIWKKYNNSFVFILPMFNDITKGIGIKGAVPHIQYPFIELAVEYGLLNTYLYKNNKYNNILYLEFDKKLLNSSKNITSVKVNSILELLISCKYYEGFYMNSDYIYMMLKIDPKYDNDIKKIEEGKYSEVSPGYLDMINLKQKFVAISKIKECEDIAKFNIGYQVATQTSFIKTSLEKEINIKIEDKSELYEKFNKKKENWIQK